MTLSCASSPVLDSNQIRAPLPFPGPSLTSCPPQSKRSTGFYPWPFHLPSSYQLFRWRRSQLLPQTLVCSLSAPCTAGATPRPARGALIFFILSCLKNVPRDPRLSPERHTHTSKFLFDTSVRTFGLNALNQIKLTTSSLHPARVPMSVSREGSFRPPPPRLHCC